MTGTLGVLIKAKKEGYVNELKPILRRMVEEGISYYTAREKKVSLSKGIEAWR